MKYPYNLFLGSSLADLSKSKNMLSFSTRAYSSFIYQHNHRLPSPPKGDTFKVLLVIANPYRTLAKALELSEEARLIEYGILGSGKAERIEIIKHFVRTESDLLDIVRTQQPDLLHFVGGSDLSGLALMQSNDVLRPLEWVQIANIFEQISHECSAVFLHAYLPNAQLDGICQSMPVVLGVDSANAAPTAKSLIATFYGYLARTNSPAEAYACALQTLNVLDETRAPVLQRVQIMNANLSLQYMQGDVWIQETAEWETFLAQTSIRVHGNLNPDLIRLGFEQLACMESYCDNSQYQTALMCALKGNMLGALRMMDNWQEANTNVIWRRVREHLRANLFSCMNDLERCESVLLEVIAWDNAWENYYALALLYQHQARWQDSKLILKRALSIPLLTWRQQAKLYLLLGKAYEYVGEWERAVQFYEETLGIQRGQVLANKELILPYLARLLHNLGVLHQKANLFEKSKQYFTEALRLAEELIHVSPRWYAAGYAQTLNSTGNLYYRCEDYDAAEMYYRKSLALYRMLVRWDSTVFLANTATTLNNLAGLLAYKDLTDADIVPFYEEALHLRRQLAMRDAAQYLPDIATTLNNFATVLVDMGQPHKAEVYFVEALDIRRKAVIYNRHLYLPRLAVTLHNLANLYSDLGNAQAASDAYEETLQIRTALAEENPRTYEPELGVTYVNYSEHILSVLQQPARAYTTLQKGINLMMPKYKDLPFVQRYMAVANSILKRIEVK